MLAQTRNFRRAAALRYISQPSLSQQIRRLETELGVELVDRSLRPIELTGAGQLLAARVKDLLRQLDDMVTEIRDFDDSTEGSITIGAMQFLTLVELPRLLAGFRQTHERVRLQLRVGNTGEVREMLLNREIHVGLLHAESEPLPAHIRAEVLRRDELVVILAPDDPRVAAGHVDWEDLVDTPFVEFREGASLRIALKEAITSAGFTPQILVESADISAAIALVAQGLGAAFVPRSLAASAAATVGNVTVGDRSIVRTLLVASDDSRYRTKAMDEFTAAARKDFR